MLPAIASGRVPISSPSGTIAASNTTYNGGCWLPDSCLLRTCCRALWEIKQHVTWIQNCQQRKSYCGITMFFLFREWLIAFHWSFTLFTWTYLASLFVNNPLLFLVNGETLFTHLLMLLVAGKGLLGKLMVSLQMVHIQIYWRPLKYLTKIKWKSTFRIPVIVLMSSLHLQQTIQ